MKTILFLLFLLPIISISQKPVFGIYGGVSNYHLNAGLEAGVAQILDERISVLAYAQANSIGNEALITGGVKVWSALWLDHQRESFVAPMIAAVNKFEGWDGEKATRGTTMLFGIRYQVYGGFGEFVFQPGYFGFNVGYQFGNAKR